MTTNPTPDRLSGRDSPLPAFTVRLAGRTDRETAPPAPGTVQPGPARPGAPGPRHGMPLKRTPR